jgi:long-subunit acyl-CoA synthetase (AMP-forming)
VDVLRGAGAKLHTSVPVVIETFTFLERNANRDVALSAAHQRHSVTDRKHDPINVFVRDILVLSNGEKLPPQDAELAILHDGVFEQLMLVGEGWPFLTLLAVAKSGDEKQLVRRANERLAQFPRYVRVRRVIASPEPWTVENGLLTPTLKVKRNDVLKRFAPEIEAVYASGAAAD